MAFLIFGAGVVIGLVGGWLIRGNRAKAVRATDATTSTRSVNATPNVVKPTVQAAVPTGEIAAPAATPRTKPVSAATDSTDSPNSDSTAVVDTLGATSPELDSTEASLITTEPEQTELGTTVPEQTESKPAESGQATADQEKPDQPAESITVEPVADALLLAAPAATVPPVVVPMIDANSVAPSIFAAEEGPDDLTKIPGIGPKMAQALAASSITTYSQLANSDIPTLRAAVTGAGLRLAPSLPTWPDKAKELIDAEQR